MNKQKALHLLEDAFGNGSPILVHGTSVEAAIQLLSIGKLPSSYHKDKRNKHPEYRGYLFFIPRKKSFVRHHLYESIEIDINGKKALENRVRNYAMLTQQ